MKTWVIGYNLTSGAHPYQFPTKDYWVPRKTVIKISVVFKYILISFRIYSLLFAMERNASDKKLLVIINDKITSS